MVELLVIGVLAFFGAAIGASGALLLTAYYLRSGVVTVQLEKVLEPDGKHRHKWTTTAHPPQKQGWYCACGQRAPEDLQPEPWRLTSG